MNEQAIRFRLGIFVLAALITLAVLITLFGGFPSFFKKSKAYTVVFTNANGIAPGSPVRKSGVRIGEVRSVTLDDANGKVNVGIEIDQEFTLRKSDKATLIQVLLGGDASIAFLPPEDEKQHDLTPTEPGASLVGFLPPDPGTLLQKTGDLMPPAQEALVEIKKAFQRIDKLLPTMDEALGELRKTAKDFGEVAKAAKEIMPEVRKTNDQIQTLFKNADVAVKEFMPEVRKTNDQVQTLFKNADAAVKEMVPEIRKTNDEIRTLTKNVNAAVPTFKQTAEEAQVTLRNWGRVGERLDVMLQTNEDKIAKTLDKVKDAADRAAKLLSDDNQRLVTDILRNVKTGSDRLDAIAKNSESLVRNTDELIQEARIAVRTANKTMGKFDETMGQIGKLTGPLGERAPAIMKNLEEGTILLNKTLGDARELIQAIGRNEGSFQKFMSDPGLYNNLNDSALMVTKILPRVDRALRDFEIFADKIARHPESLGIGGVVRPGSGVKEAPSTIFPGYR